MGCDPTLKPDSFIPHEHPIRWAHDYFMFADVETKVQWINNWPKVILGEGHNRFELGPFGNRVWASKHCTLASIGGGWIQMIFHLVDRMEPREMDCQLPCFYWDFVKAFDCTSSYWKPRNGTQPRICAGVSVHGHAHVHNALTCTHTDIYPHTHQKDIAQEGTEVMVQDTALQNRHTDFFLVIQPPNDFSEIIVA